MRVALITIIVFFQFLLSSQQKIELTTPATPTKHTERQLSLTDEAKEIFGAVEREQSNLTSKDYDARTFAPSLAKHDLQPTFDPTTGEIIAIKGTIPSVGKLKTHADRCISYLEHVKDAFQLTNPAQQLISVASSTDESQRIHSSIDQVHQGIKVMGGELTVHEEQGNIYMVQGKIKNVPEDFSTTPSLGVNEIEKIAIKTVDNYKPISGKLKSLFQHEQISNELVIVKTDGSFKLAYNVDIFPSIADRETMIIDAIDGSIIDRYKTLCKYHNHDNLNSNLPVFDGRANGSATDLNGTNQNINIYQCTDGFFLVDASRAMFKGGNQTSCDNSDQLLNGVILTLDASGTSPSKDNFDYNIASSTGANNWNNQSAVSAHVNGGRAYEYFKNTFGRESITGNGTNIVSFVNVADEDGADMDNAFWNGEFIFYGNGDRAFTSPLAKALDVAGHEMSHGVIQTTANLVYQGEPGALNEHFADVFGVMIEREDFRIGEDITNPNIYRTGTLRDMGNPNNGGTRLGDPGYQPASVSEQFFGSEDNGGVHINSGIPNLAYFTFVTDESYGTDIDDRASIAERIWYKALTRYLRSTSNFADLRVAVIQAATEDFGSNVAAAAGRAFDRVGITTANVTPEVQDLETNPGQEFVVWSDIELGTIKISNNDGQEIGTLTSTDHISRPSVTDDGRFVIFINSLKQIQAVEIDWTTSMVVRDFLVGSEQIWRNAVISRDGGRIAALSGDLTNGEFDNTILIFDLSTGTQREFELFNPTFSEDNTTVGGVQYADVMEFDHTGEQLMYDAFNQLDGTFGQDLSYWDIGILDVWDNSTNNFDDGNIFKLFSGLPKDVSIGNPTFSKNSPNIIAFDFIETDPLTEEQTYKVLGLDRENGDVDEIFENNTLGYPSYSLDDQNIIFNVTNNGANILGTRTLAANKISSSGDAFIFLEGANWGVYMGNGSRDLTTPTEDLVFDEVMLLYPNPTKDILYLESQEDQREAEVRIYNSLGQEILRKEMFRETSIDLSDQAPGTYLLEYRFDDKRAVKRIVKL